MCSVGYGYGRILEIGSTPKDTRRNEKNYCTFTI